MFLVGVVVVVVSLVHEVKESVDAVYLVTHFLLSSFSFPDFEFYLSNVGNARSQVRHSTRVVPSLE